ncbi:peptidase propeptide and YPEB domain protein [Burkholderia pseudomallei]|uniref:PepSY domain-containing protein n=1 Tax=Burkholderia pseudomallei TaxID=28450 RepID=UPI000537D8AD|nr:PepSY domain-containing protein [Burkholderia pseudomallei]KGV31206.1 peptidase propeptide and YPEB domain protein [Burkholderia pseudomallei MSHR4012]KGV55363.1 peptidase propeptide and YPEB domain protein [Burkholderia pseudomallei MSHR4003]KGW43538.1 peptidase propeptide and YPEB domain protein [Burkholderia pseudomallei MSHR1000]KGX42257.1 peptidase propeptide and YPEB domain protein [Burkholderia pseudomallei MSHR3335]CAJ8360663.1 peptidase propeptide and YPEB domain protein [Burkholde
MKTSRLIKAVALAALVLGGALGIRAAMADDGDDCRAPLADWKPRDAVRALAQQKGWRVDKLKADDGCYEIKGHDADGKRFKAKLDPVTLDVVRMKREGERKRDHDDDDDHGRAPDARAPAGGPPAGAPPGGVLKPGSKPDVQIR